MYVWTEIRPCQGYVPSLVPCITSSVLNVRLKSTCHKQRTAWRSVSSLVAFNRFATGQGIFIKWLKLIFIV